MNVFLITLMLIIFNKFFIAKSHSKSFSFQNKLNKLSAHLDDPEHNDIDHHHHHHDDDDDDHHHHDKHHKSNDISITKPINVHLDHTPLIKNPSKKVVAGNTISQLIAFKQFIVNSIFNLLTRPAQKVSFGIHYSKARHPITASTTMNGIVYSGEDDDEHHHHKDESIIIANSPHSSSGHHSTAKPSEEHHKPDDKYHNFYSSVSDNIMTHTGHQPKKHYYANPHNEMKFFEFIPNTGGVQPILY